MHKPKELGTLRKSSLSSLGQLGTAAPGPLDKQCARLPSDALGGISAAPIGDDNQVRALAKQPFEQDAQVGLFIERGDDYSEL